VTHELRIQRHIEASPELVFDTMVDVDVHAELYAPEGFTLLEDEMDLRVGGTWRMVLAGPDGRRSPITYVFTEVDRPHRLAATMTMTEGGETVSSSLVVTFEELDGATLVTLVQGGFETEGDRDASRGGATPFLERLEAASTKRRETEPRTSSRTTKEET
jgi:uncharacterized protein YndB with AHSA1/START domain